MSSEFRRQASLVLNIFLAVTVGALALPKLNRAPSPSVIKSGPGRATNETPIFTKPPQAPRSPPALPRYSDITLSASDRRRLIIDQLRAMGAPNEVLALVARMDREVEWDGRFQECRGDMNKQEELQLEKDKSQDAEMLAALGAKDFKQWDTKIMLWEAMSTEVETTASEAEAIYASKKRLAHSLLDAQYARFKGTMDDKEADAVYDKAYAEYNQQLKAALGEERYAKSQQMDDAFQAGLLRLVLNKGAVKPSDSQFQELFKIEKEYDAAQTELNKWAVEAPSSVNVVAQDRALTEARDREYERVLGHEAFDALQKSKDPGYAQMKKYEAYWGLDDTKINYVYDAMKEYNGRLLELTSQARALQDQGQNIDAINSQLKELAAQTGRTLQNYLGQDRFNKLQRNSVVLLYSAYKPRPH